jgi:23S rRNA (adenine2503-C2)-methyltransferase
MGMGEPLANYTNLIHALNLLNAQWGANIGARKITISTSGLAPQIRQLAKEPHQYRLAISLHGATDEVRDKIMPINRKYPLSQLISAAEEYQSLKNGMVTLEYILIADLNDSPEQALALADIANYLRAKVNLIPYNKVNDFIWERPTQTAQDAFIQELAQLGVPVTLRHEKGHDIDAACGQLRLRAKNELEAQGE